MREYKQCRTYNKPLWWLLSLSARICAVKEEYHAILVSSQNFPGDMMGKILLWLKERVKHWKKTPPQEVKEQR